MFYVLAVAERAAERWYWRCLDGRFGWVLGAIVWRWKRVRDNALGLLCRVRSLVLLWFVTLLRLCILKVVAHDDDDID